MRDDLGIMRAELGACIPGRSRSRPGKWEMGQLTGALLLHPPARPGGESLALSSPSLAYLHRTRPQRRVAYLASLPRLRWPERRPGYHYPHFLPTPLGHFWIAPCCAVLPY